MKYNFSSDFVKVINPDTSFADAWETICCTLLKQEYGENDIINLKAPEKGIDIWRPSAKVAFQCKSSESGSQGRMNMTKITESIESALTARGLFDWREYMICINTGITGSGYEKLLVFEKSKGLSESEVKILNADYWSKLAEKYISSIEQYLDYRLLVTEDEVKSAFEKARYYDKYVQQHMSIITSAPVSIKLTNNRTPICIELPFSQDLTIGQLLDVAKTLFGVDMKPRQYPGLGTSASPSVSLLYGGTPQSFNKKISEVIVEGNNSFELWVKIVWRDFQDDGIDKKILYNMRSIDLGIAGAYKNKNRGRETVGRMESYCQDNMWDAAVSIRNGTF